jgi:hypothetical protein
MRPHPGASPSRPRGIAPDARASLPSKHCPRTQRPAATARAGRRNPKPHPRPTNGIVVAVTVMKSTFASSGRLAM